ncbi:MAG: prepilin-type N-terminal cleavage/methylation domain-containing protein [Bacillota bacterium]
MIKNNKGVTLVELLIVIVILGIIAAVSIPAVGNIVENAEKDAVLADATNIKSQASLCITSGDCDVPDTGDDPNYYGADVIDDYIDQVSGSYIVQISDDGSIEVAIDTGEYWYVGDPAVDNDRDDDILDTDPEWTTDAWNEGTVGSASPWA